MKGKKLIPVVLIASMLSFSSVVYAKEDVNPVGESNSVIEQREKESIQGDVVKVNLNGKWNHILVGENGHPTSVFVISNDTIIVNSKGQQLSIYDIEEGMHIRAYHNGISTKSLPPQYVAEKIVVESEKEGDLVTEGIIYNINSLNDKEDKELWIKGRKASKDALTKVNLIVNKDTEIIDQNGEKLKIQDLKKGIVIEGIYGRKLTKSCPAKGVAKKIIVRKDKAMTEGKITSISIMDKYTKVLIREDEYLIVDENTTIEDMCGNKIALKDLKEGMKLLALGSPAVALSYPSQRVVYNIIVMD